MAASNGFLPGEYDEMKDKPMLLMKKGSSDGHGITALISRQLQGNFVENEKKTFFGVFCVYTYTVCVTTACKFCFISKISFVSCLLMFD